MTSEPTRLQIDATTGPVLIEFGSETCGWCRAAQPLIAEALVARPGLRHLKVEDGRGRPLGRSFGVKLWPTLVALLDGREVGRIVRPQTAQELDAALEPLRSAS